MIGGNAAEVPHRCPEEPAIIGGSPRAPERVASPSLKEGEVPIRFNVEHFRLSDDGGRPLEPTQIEKTTTTSIDEENVEGAIAAYLSGGVYEMVGEPSSYSGSRALLTVRKGRAIFAVHVFPAEREDEDVVPG